MGGSDGQRLRRLRDQLSRLWLLEGRTGTQRNFPRDPSISNCPAITRRARLRSDYFRRSFSLSFRWSFSRLKLEPRCRRVVDRRGGRGFDWGACLCTAAVWIESHRANWKRLDLRVASWHPFANAWNSRFRAMGTDDRTDIPPRNSIAATFLLQPHLGSSNIHNRNQELQRDYKQGMLGLEGAGLMLVFGTLWLWFFRREYRFPQALSLIPVGVLVLWLANSVRIAALILIGNAGAPGVAERGFHSQAGWIAFNAVALGFTVSARRLRWFSLSAEEVSVEQSSVNPAAPYLLPFLMILATGMISHAAASGFEWLYPMRFFAAIATLWFFRKNYKSLGWRVSWISPVVGIVVFALWVGLDRIAGTHADNGIQAGLESLSGPARFGWLACRTLAAVITVPIAEELAFRGFLIRRLISPDFDSLSLKTFTWVSVLVSSAAFGLMHGDQWLAGSVAGLLYAAALLYRGSLADAIVAHSATNALLAALVLFGGYWHFW